MAGVQQYKCPCCGGALEFNTDVQKVKCPYCDTEFEMEALTQCDECLSEDASDDICWQSLPGSEWGEGETSNMRLYVCKSCGGEIVGDENMAASKCPYCDNPIVVMGQFSGDLKPDLVIPFKLDKKAAMEKLNKHLTGKKFLPKVFKDQHHIEDIQAIYVPFWLFDADADAKINYDATATRSWSDSKYNYSETSHYRCYRAGSIGFDHIPVDGSKKMADDLMESIEPFDFKDAVDFQTAYLAGYLADRYDVTAEDSIERANRRVKNSTEAAFMSTVTVGAPVVKNSQINIKNGSAKYALYPVWVLNTTWKDEKYAFAMNGQTGKFVGNLPCDKGIRRKYLWSFTLAGTAIITALSYLIWLL